MSRTVYSNSNIVIENLLNGFLFCLNHHIKHHIILSMMPFVEILI